MFIKTSSGMTSHPKLRTYEEGCVLPVLTKDELLFTHRHKGLLRLVNDLAEISEEDFNYSYGQVIHNFMEFAQVLPHKTNGILGSLLNYGLASAVATYQKYCQLKRPQATPLVKFAVFTAALLRDVGRVMTNQRVVLTDEKGDFLENWNPFSGPMLGRAKFFKMYPIATSYLRIEKTITPLFARQIIPEDYFLWLSHDPLLFADWLAALLGEEGVGTKELTLAMALVKREDLIGVLTTLDGADVLMQESLATEYGEAFYRWLKEGIEKGDIQVNTDKAGVHVVSEGVLLEQKLFKQFADLFKLPVNFLVVYQQVGNLMGIAKKGGADFLHAAYFSPVETGGGNYSSFASSASRVRSHREGMVVSAQDVFINKAVDAVSDLKSAKSMRAVDHHFPMRMIEAQLKAK